MKKMSFIRKLRLAANAVERSTLSFFPFLILTTLVTVTPYRSAALNGEVSEAVSEAMLAICVVVSNAAFNAMYALLVPSLFMQRMKFFETLPVTVPEIRETAMLHVLMCHLMTTVPQCAVVAVIMPSLLPYLFCAQCVQLMLVMTFIMPFYLTDKYMYTPANALEDKKRKSVMKKGAFVGIGFLVLMGADYGFILGRGLRPQGTGDAVLLAVISAGALIISAVSAVICRKLRNVR